MTGIRTSPKSEAEMRNTFQAIVDRLPEATPAGTVLDGVGSLTISNPPTQAEVVAVRDAVAALVTKLKAAKVLQ